MEDFEKYVEHFGKVFWKILTIISFVKFCVSKIFRNVSRNITKIFENHFENFQKKFRKISRIIMESLEKYFRKI